MKEIKDFIRKEEALYLMNMIDQHASRSMVVGSGNQMNEYNNARTSYTSNLIANDPTVESLHKRIAKYLGQPLKKGESLQGQRYEVGQYFNDHVDYFSGDQYQKNCLSSGNRTWTFMLYLNDDFEGGATHFRHLNKRITPESCKAVVWNNLQNGYPNEYMLHCGLVVRKGIKYIITSWWRENIWNGGEDAKEYENKLKSNQLSII